MNELAKAFSVVGLALVLAGVALLGYLGYTVFLIVDAPEKVGLVKFILSHLGSGNAVFHGHAGRETFELNFSEPARTVVLLFFGVAMFWIMARIAQSIIAAGLALVRNSNATTPQTEK